MATMKQEATDNMTAQEEAWIAGRFFITDAQKARFLAFRSGGRLGLLSVLKQQSENLFPAQSTPMTIDANNTARKVDSSILAVLKDSTDKQIEAMIMDPAPEGTDTNNTDDLPTLVEVRYPYDRSIAKRSGIYGICVRTEVGQSLHLADLMEIFKDLEAYHAGLVLDPHRNVMIRPRQTPAEAQKFQKIDEQVGGFHYVETSLLQQSTRRYCTTQQHMKEYQDSALKWREISASISARFSGAKGNRTRMSTPLFTDVGASSSLGSTSQQHVDGEMSHLMGLVNAIAQTLPYGKYTKFEARTYMLAPLPNTELVPMAVHVFALLVGAYIGQGGVKKYDPGEFVNFPAGFIRSERRTRVRDDGFMNVRPMRDIDFVTAYPEMNLGATTVMTRPNFKRKLPGEREQLVPIAKDKQELRAGKVEELEESMKNTAGAARTAANAAEKRYKKLKVTADKMEKMLMMALTADEDMVEVEEE